MCTIQSVALLVVRSKNNCLFGLFEARNLNASLMSTGVIASRKCSFLASKTSCEIFVSKETLSVLYTTVGHCFKVSNNVRKIDSEAKTYLGLPLTGPLISHQGSYELARSS